MRRSVVAVVVAALCLTASPAIAFTPPEPAANTPQNLIDQVNGGDVFGPTPAGWVPQGRRVATSRFKVRDQIRFLNYTNSAQSFPNRVNHFYLGAPAVNPKNMTRSDVFRVIGPDACIGGVRPCELTLSAAAWRRATNSAMGGGHCWGLATTAAEVFNGDVPPNTVGAGRRSLFDADLNSKLTRQIARAWSTQTLISLKDFAVTPNQAVELLRAQLRPGVAPFVAAITSGSTGHAVVPTALYQRSGGHYDVAVYDNNYPGRVRAVHIDTNSDTFEYLFLNQIGDESQVATKKIYLVPVSALKTPIICPLCRTNKTQLIIAPVATTDPIIFDVNRPDGSPLSGLDVNYPTDPIGYDGVQSFPQYFMPAKSNFRLRIDGSKLSTAVETDVTIINRDASWYLRDVDIAPGSVDTVTVRQRRGELTYYSSRGADPTMEVIDGTGDTEWSFEFSKVSLEAGEQSTIRLNQNKSRLVVRSSATKPTVLDIQGIVNGPDGAASVRAVDVPLPPGGSVRILYRKFLPYRPQELVAISQQADGQKSRLDFDLVWVPL